MIKYAITDPTDRYDWTKLYDTKVKQIMFVHLLRDYIINIGMISFIELLSDVHNVDVFYTHKLSV